MLRWSVRALALALMVVAVWLCQSALPLPWAAGLASLLLLASCWAGWRAAALQRPCGLSILQDGRILLRTDGNAPRLVRLQLDSTLWPQALFLRLREANGRVHAVLVLPDSLSRSEFRALLVSCHWLAVKELPEKNL